MTPKKCFKGSNEIFVHYIVHICVLTETLYIVSTKEIKCVDRLHLQLEMNVKKTVSCTQITLLEKHKLIIVVQFGAWIE